MEFRVGDKVVYPNQGVGIIEQININFLNGRAERCYLIRIVANNLRVTIPEAMTSNVGLRRVVSSSEAKKILAFLGENHAEPNGHHDWKHRFKENAERMRTGLLLDVAAVVKNLLALSKVKPLSFREKKMLEHARYLLVSELATAQRAPERRIEAEICRALAKAKLSFPTNSVSS